MSLSLSALRLSAKAPNKPIPLILEALIRVLVIVPSPATISATTLAIFSMLLVALVISPPPKAELIASTKPMPIISLALFDATVKASIFPAYVSAAKAACPVKVWFNLS